MSKRRNQAVIFAVLLFVFLGMNFSLWLTVRDVQAKWGNVPPPPNKEASAGAGLGDKQFAYRSISMMLQNLGDSGGRYTPLKDYNYDRLAEWFFLADKLDAESDYIPFLAAFYFGNVQEPQKLPPVIEYLHEVGKRGENEKWRWLAQGVHLAKYRVQDLDLAYKLADALSNLKDIDMPIWAKNMNVLIMSDKGEKQAAYEMFMNTLQSDNLSTYETLFIVDHICTELLDEREAKAHPLCQQLPQ